MLLDGLDLSDASGVLWHGRDPDPSVFAHVGVGLSAISRVKAESLAAGQARRGRVGGMASSEISPMSSTYRDRITLEPGKRGGKPCIRGLRITVQDVLQWLASGQSVQDILADYPQLAAEDIQAALAYAADRERPTAWVHAA